MVTMMIKMMVGGDESGSGSGSGGSWLADGVGKVSQKGRTGVEVGEGTRASHRSSSKWQQRG